MKTNDGVKLDNNKRRWSLLPFDIIACVIDVLEYGAKKYSLDNWKYVENGGTRYFDAAMRHIHAWKMGVRYDTESGYHHLAHAICSLVFCMWHECGHRDRPF